MPRWVNGDTFPCSYEHISGTQVHRYILGLVNDGQRAVCTTHTPPEAWQGDELVILAHGAYKAVVHRDCSRIEAETIAKGWLLAVSKARGEVLVALDRPTGPKAGH